MCRDLFLAAITDPVAGLGAGLDIDQLRRITPVHHWVLVDAHQAAVALGDEELAVAFLEVSALDLVGALSAGDEAIAEIAIARADPAIVDALSRAEQRCR